ncbi:MAG: C1 family peptidase, partial [Bacteroidota bacterium]
MKFFSTILLLFTVFYCSIAQDTEKKKTGGYTFTDKHTVKYSPVKNQYQSGTCWSFATISFVESEILRNGGSEYDLSEMFFVYYAYIQKSWDYVSYHGNNNLSEGGQAHDVMNIMKKYGLVPEDVYKGLNYGEEKHIHAEMVAMLKGMLDGLLKNENTRLSTAWKSSVECILSSYLGDVPSQFTAGGKKHTPESYLKETGINPDEYIELTSCNHVPFYEKFILKIPDNWSRDLYYNLPLDDFIAVVDHALENGYSVCWDGDVSENEFSFKNGVAIVPEKPWSEMNTGERLALYTEITPERKITQETRQKEFENFSTSDDHLMHIVGIG